MEEDILKNIKDYIVKYPEDKDAENEIMYYKPVDWNVNIIDKNLKMKSSRNEISDFYYDRFFKESFITS